jgi:hypothetical protein
MISIAIDGLELGRVQLAESHTLEWRPRPSSGSAKPPPPILPPEPDRGGGGGENLPSKLEILARALILDGYLIAALGVAIVLLERRRRL